MAAIVRIANLSVGFDRDAPIFDDIDLEVLRGELMAIVGVSGAGKSTLLRVIADLIPAQRGSVQIVEADDPQRRHTAMVFQEARLMPWRTVASNVALGLEGLAITAQARSARVQSALALVGLADYGSRWPYQLSGGQRQRVGLARALAVDPDLLLMDEPFGALDAITRGVLQQELLRVRARTGKSILFVTHDIEEAVLLGDRVMLLGGRPARIVHEYPVATPGAPRPSKQIQATIAQCIRNGLHKVSNTTEQRAV